jgi:hypothetical protein
VFEKALPVIALLLLPALASCNSASMPSERISLDEATQLVRAEIFRDRPAMNPAAEFPLEERTTDEIWQRMGAQVFQVTESVAYGQFYITRDGRVEFLGASPWGVCAGELDMYVTDLDSNGRPELVYTYETGSGISYAYIAAYSGDWPEPVSRVPMMNMSGGRVVIDRTSDQEVHVQMAYYDFVAQEPVVTSTLLLGQVELEQTGGQPRLVLRLENDLPVGVELMAGE